MHHYLLFLFISLAFSQFQFISIEGTTLLLDLEYNQRTIRYCSTGNCSDVMNWISLDAFDSSVSLPFKSIYSGLHPAISTIKAIVLYDGAIDTFGYNYQIEKARLRLLDDFDFELDFIADVSYGNTGATINQLNASGYNVIIGTSNGHNSIYGIFSQYPNIKFLMINLNYLDFLLTNVTTGFINFYSFNYFWQIRYLSALLASKVSQTNQSCFIIPVASPDMIEIVNYNYLGLNEGNPNHIFYGYPINTYQNEALELYALEKCLSEHPNVDTIIYHTNGNIIPKVAASRGLKVIGYTIEGRILYGENVVMGIEINWYNIFYDFLTQLVNGTDVPRNTITYLLGNGYQLGSFSSIVSRDDVNYIRSVAYSISEGTYQFNCTPSVGILCQRLGKCNGTCITEPTTTWWNNSNFILSPIVVIPPKILTAVYVDFDKTNAAPILLFFNIVAIIYFLIPITTICIGLGQHSCSPSSFGKNSADFLLTSFFGAIVLVIASIVSIGIPSVWRCQSQIALISIGFNLFFLPFFVRTVRIFAIKLGAKRQKEIIIPSKAMHGFVWFMVLVEIAYLIGWFYTAPLELGRIAITNTSTEETFYLDCVHSDPVVGNKFLLVSVFEKFIFSFVCLLLSDKILLFGVGMSSWTKEKKEKYAELTNASEIKAIVVATFVLLDIVSICFVVLSINVISKFIALSVVVYVFTILCPINITITLFSRLIAGDSILDSLSSAKSKGTSSTHTNSTQDPDGGSASERSPLEKKNESKLASQATLNDDY